MHKLLLTLLAAILCSGCGILSTSSKYELKDGIYRSDGFGGNRVYVSIADDSIIVFPINNVDAAISADTAQSLSYRQAHDKEETIPPKVRIYKSSLDMDVLTMPFKYRPSVSNFPNQLNTSFNGAFYTGYRTDRYSLSYSQMPLGNYKRMERHYGYSIGAFTGVGATPMNPWVTLYNIDSEYDGFIWLNGIAAIIAIQNLSFGIGAGADLLLDRNRNVWIYHGKPWISAAIGLNLN